MAKQNCIKKKGTASSEALKLFDRYKKCKEVYSKIFAGGCSIMQLIVAA